MPGDKSQQDQGEGDVDIGPLAPVQAEKNLRLHGHVSGRDHEGHEQPKDGNRAKVHKEQSGNEIL